MKLIEKKCPNCGGKLEFNETDKSCECDYCHRAFEIERDEKLDINDIAEQFDLKELEKNMKEAEKLLNKIMPSNTPFMIIFTIGMLLIIGIIIFAIIGI